MVPMAPLARTSPDAEQPGARTVSPAVRAPVPTSDPTEGASMTSRGKAATWAAGRFLAAALVLLFAFTTLYVAAFHAPRPKGFDVALVGTPAQAAELQSALDARRRGAFDVRRYDSEGAAREALLRTDVHGVVVRGLLIDRVLVAGALGVAPTQTVTAALKSVAAPAT